MTTWWFNDKEKVNFLKQFLVLIFHNILSGPTCRTSKTSRATSTTRHIGSAAWTSPTAITAYNHLIIKLLRRRPTVSRRCSPTGSLLSTKPSPMRCSPVRARSDIYISQTQRFSFSSRPFTLRRRHVYFLTQKDHFYQKTKNYQHLLRDTEWWFCLVFDRLQHFTFYNISYSWSRAVKWISGFFKSETCNGKERKVCVQNLFGLEGNRAMQIRV